MTTKYKNTMSIRPHDTIPSVNFQKGLGISFMSSMGILSSNISPALDLTNSPKVKTFSLISSISCCKASSSIFTLISISTMQSRSFLRCTGILRQRNTIVMIVLLSMATLTSNYETVILSFE